MAHESLLHILREREQKLIEKLPKAENGKQFDVLQPQFFEAISARNAKDVVQLRQDPNKVWEMDKFDELGKYNQLSLDKKSGFFTLTIIKPGSQTPKIIRWCLIDDAQNVQNYMRTVSKDWDKTHSKPEKFDGNGEEEDGNTFEFGPRYFNLGNGYRLCWHGKHKRVRAYYHTVNDTLAVEKIPV